VLVSFLQNGLCKRTFNPVPPLDDLKLVMSTSQIVILYSIKTSHNHSGSHKQELWSFVTLKKHWQGNMS
jgi:hypothetical protein